MTKGNKDLKTQMDQLSALLSAVPDEEEAVIGLRESVIEQLHPLLSKVLSGVNMQIEFPSCYSTVYFLGAGGWSNNLRSQGIPARQIAESCTEEILRTSLIDGVEKLIKEMERRRKDSSSEKAKLIKLLTCLTELQK